MQVAPMTNTIPAPPSRASDFQIIYNEKPTQPTMYKASALTSTASKFQCAFYCFMCMVYSSGIHVMRPIWGNRTCFMYFLKFQLLILRLFNVEIYIEKDCDLELHSRDLIISNHQTWMDIPVSFCYMVYKN